MKHFQPRSFPKRAQVGFYVFTSLVGGFIHNTSLVMLLFCFGFTVAAPAADTAKAFWRHPGVRSFIAALEADLAGIGSVTADLGTPPPLHLKNMAKVQRDENKDRRKLAAELRQSKASAGSMKAVRQPGRRI
jgi:hypothetical protein